MKIIVHHLWKWKRQNTPENNLVNPDIDIDLTSQCLNCFVNIMTSLVAISSQRWAIIVFVLMSSDFYPTRPIATVIKINFTNNIDIWKCLKQFLSRHKMLLKHFIVCLCLLFFFMFCNMVSYDNYKLICELWENLKKIDKMLVKCYIYIFRQN